ncbi:MAG TPA: Gfo/Idh/MocA family oxidoreductase [Burkholderiales bacterium]|nr:Gfo/Idh/MocA family oxidoreductase [Burkholderiales bacterium]
MINVAIIGLGWWGKNIVNAVQNKSDKIRFVHGVSHEPDTVRGFANEKGFTLSTTLEAALADPQVQAVALATPHSTHRKLCEQAAAAGKAVFCEKPFALKFADALAMTDACKKAGVPVAVGQNKRFWPSMVELRKVVASGMLGRVLHIEGHYSNENSSNFFAPWRDLPSETPGAGMTGTGIHILDAFTNLAGPAAEVSTQFISTRAGHNPLDTISVLFRFANGVSGFLGAVRPSPFYWRMQVFGDQGSAEALGETECITRISGGKTERKEFPKIDSLLAEFNGFADAVAGTAPYPITPDEIVNTIGAFEAITTSIETGKPVRLTG